MKKIKKILGVAVLLMLLMSKAVYASTFRWEELTGHHNNSILLKNGQTVSEDIVNDSARGRIMSTATLSITNEEDGTLYIVANIFVHKNIDKAYQTIFLDKWDDTREDWVQIGSWDFERTKEEEENGVLSSYHVGMTVSGCELNCYYRARAMHLVQIGDDMEGKATETNGILLTDHAD